MKKLAAVIFALALAVSCNRKEDLHIVLTSDVHGAYFDSTYVSDRTQTCLFNVKWYVDSLRNAVGKKNVLLIDNGDFLQGDNAAYYYNYVDTVSPHVYPLIAKEIGYDVVTVGNHDIETGHAVYDRINSDFSKAGIPFLAANAVKPDGKSYFRDFVVLKKAGRRVLVLGCTNASIKTWLGEEKWYGMDFKSLVPYVQNYLDSIKRDVKADITIVAAHSGTGWGDGRSLESQGLDMLNSLRGVDVVLAAHDHRPCIERNGNVILANSGSKARDIAHVTIPSDGTEPKAEIIKVNKDNIDHNLQSKFHGQYEAVKAFTVRKIGTIARDMDASEALKGQSFFMDLIHTVQLEATGAQVSFGAPLRSRSYIKAGDLLYDDLFKIYAYENTLYKIALTGRQIKDYLEYAYDHWCPPTPSYNYDSAGGLNYTVDYRKAAGQRVRISSLSDGSAFREDDTYTVAINSYRFNGGGNILIEGAHIAKEDLESLVLDKYPEVRELIYQFILREGDITLSKVGNTGKWYIIK